MIAPTRTTETEARYRKRARRILERAARETGTDLSHHALIDWFEAKAERWSPSTVRQYRAALVFAFEKVLVKALAAGNHLSATAYASAVDRLRAVDRMTGRKAGPAPSAKGKRQTSAGKRKSLSGEQAAAVMHGLDGLGHKYADLARGLMRFGPDVGLRPSEWQTAMMSRGFLAVQTAKATNGRACGAERLIDLRACSADYVADLTAFLAALKTAVAKEGRWPRVADGIARALRAASDAAGDAFPALRRSPVTPYTLRHVAAARMKAELSRAEVAAILGHASDETAGSHYARASFAGGWPPILARASEQNLVLVRTVAKPHYRSADIAAGWDGLRP